MDGRILTVSSLQVDVFKIESPDLGKLYRVDIGHDNSGPSSEWYLEAVEVADLETQQSYTFPCSLWISKGKDGQLERVLYVKGHEDSHTNRRISMISGRRGRSISSSSQDRSVASNALLSVGSARRIDKKSDPDAPGTVFCFAAC